MTDAKTVCGGCKEYVDPACGGHTINCPECGYTMYSYQDARGGRETRDWDETPLLARLAFQTVRLLLVSIMGLFTLALTDGFSTEVFGESPLSTAVVALTTGVVVWLFLIRTDPRRGNDD